MDKITRQEVIDGWESTANRKQVQATYDEYAKEVAIQFLKDCIIEDAFVRPNIRGRWYHGDEEDAHGQDTAREIWDQVQKYKNKSTR